MVFYQHPYRNHKSIKLTLTNAHGYFDLGLFTEAWETLDVLPVEVRESNEAMGLRLKILAATERWEKCQFLAEGLVQSSPDWMIPYLIGAKAMDQQGFTGDAVEFLLLGERLMPNDPQFLFQWASYEAKLGNLAGAKIQIGKLIDVAPDWRLKVMEDPAFESLW